MTRRPMIVHIVHSLDTGGLENGVVNLVNASGSGFGHSVICMKAAGSLRHRLNAGVEVFELGKGEGHDLGAVGKLVKLLRQIRPAIVHSRNWGTFEAIVAARLAGVRVVVHGEHGREIADPEGENSRRNRIRRMLSPLVSCFVAVSEDLRRWLVERVGLPATKVITIRNGVDTERFSGHTRAHAREALGLPGDGVVIGTVGRLDPIKDQGRLVRAFATTLASCPDAILVIAGDGPCRGELERLVSTFRIGQRAHLLGERRDIPRVLAALDVFVLPSIAEGMSNTLLEAMASGLPVIATRVGGSPELVEDGLGGRLVAPQHEGELARAIIAYCDDPHLRALHGKSARERAVNQFSLGRMCDAYVTLYSRLSIGRQAGSQ